MVLTTVGPCALCATQVCFLTYGAGSYFEYVMDLAGPLCLMQEAYVFPASYYLLIALRQYRARQQRANRYQTADEKSAATSLSGSATGDPSLAPLPLISTVRGWVGYSALLVLVLAMLVAVVISLAVWWAAGPAPDVSPV